MTFGVQTFTVRKAQKKDIEKAYLPLIQMGITSFEVARIDFTPNNASILKDMIAKYGIAVSAIQVKPKYVFGAFEEVVRFCRETNCKNVVISMLPFRCILGKEQAFYSFVEELDGWFERYAKEGITLAYHHHNWEYIQLSNGKRRMEELLKRTHKIQFVHDTYWTAKSGISPTAQIEAFGGRLLGIHLRDLQLKKKNGIGVMSVDGAIGDGLIDFAAVLKAAESVGCSYYVIEQNTKNPYKDIEKSFTALQSIKTQLREGQAV